MNKWQKQVQQSLLKSEEDVIKQLKKQYRSALSDIMAKVEQYDADIKNIDKALENTALDDNARAVLLSQRQSKIYQKQYQETLKAQISGIIDKLNADNYTAINDYLNGTYNDAFVGTVYDMANQGVPFIMPVNQAAVTNAVLVNSKISGGLYEALGINAKKLKKRIAEEISRGIAQNMSYTDIARNLVNTSGIGINNAVRIIRTEGHRIQQTATHDAQIQAKAKGADVLKQWDAALDGKTRPLHRLLDGQIREVEEPFEADGIKVDRPGEFGIASQDINCRCAVMTRARWALDENELQILKDRAAYYGLDKSKEFDDFKKKYLTAVESEDTIIDIQAVRKDLRAIDRNINVLTQQLHDARTIKRLDPTRNNIDEQINDLNKQLSDLKKDKTAKGKLLVKNLSKTFVVDTDNEEFISFILSLDSKTEYKEVLKHNVVKTFGNVISDVAGGDKTNGSCASVGLAYIGQKYGLDVLDFRDGESREFFSSKSSKISMWKSLGVSFVTESSFKSDLSNGKAILKNCELGKEYYLSVGRHAAIVRLIEEDVLDKHTGEVLKTIQKYQYLELQSSYKNGWKDFYSDVRETLKHRFGCTNGSSFYNEAYLTEISQLKDSNEFRTILGYINTDSAEQRKGAGGNIK